MKTKSEKMQALIDAIADDPALDAGNVIAMLMEASVQQQRDHLALIQRMHDQLVQQHAATLSQVLTLSRPDIAAQAAMHAQQARAGVRAAQAPREEPTSPAPPRYAEAPPDDITDAVRDRVLHDTDGIR